jgi:hypothetical protein
LISFFGLYFFGSGKKRKVLCFVFFNPKKKKRMILDECFGFNLEKKDDYGDVVVFLWLWYL